MAEINLLAKKNKKKNLLHWMPTTKIFPAILLGIIILIICGSYSAISANSFKELAELEKQIIELEAISTKASFLTEEIAVLESEIADLHEIVENKMKWGPILLEINKIIPSDIWLEQLQMREKESLTMVGYADSLADIGLFTKGLGFLPYFTSARLKSAVEIIMDNAVVIKFEIICGFSGQEEL